MHHAHNIVGILVIAVILLLAISAVGNRS